MQVLTNQTIYKCDHCGKKSFTRLTHHEHYCKKNPDNQHKCFEFCKHLHKDKVEGSTVFTCRVKKIDLYSYIAERRRYHEKGYMTGFEERMPLSCADYYDERIDWQQTREDLADYDAARM